MSYAVSSRANTFDVGVFFTFFSGKNFRLCAFGAPKKAKGRS